MSKKRSSNIQLSKLLDNAVGDYNPTPNLKQFSKIAHVVKKQEQTGPVLRLQLLTKLKSHPFRFIPSLEIYYCLCLMEYLVVKVKGFDVYIKDQEFVKALEKMAQFDKLSGIFKTKPTLTQLKAMNLIQLLMTYPNTEHYHLLYEKYNKKSTIFPPLIYPEYEDSVESKTPSVCQTPSLMDSLETNEEYVVDGVEISREQREKMKEKKEMMNAKFSPSLPQPPRINTTVDEEIFESLKPEFKKLLQEMATFHELCKEPLKKSNLLRNGSLQIRHQLQCDSAFYQKANEMQRDFKKHLTEFQEEIESNGMEEEYEEVLTMLKEENRKIGHIVKVLSNEITRLNKLETKIENGVGDCVLAEVPSYDVDAMLTPGITHPETNRDAGKIVDYMNHTKCNSLSRDDSATESVTESESNSATPCTSKHAYQKRIQVMPPVPHTQTKPISFKRNPSNRNMNSVDTNRFYLGYL